MPKNSKVNSKNIRHSSAISQQSILVARHPHLYQYRPSFFRLMSLSTVLLSDCLLVKIKLSVSCTITYILYVPNYNYYSDSASFAKQKFVGFGDCQKVFIHSVSTLKDCSIIIIHQHLL